MECRILAGYREFGRKLKEVIPEKPKICIKSHRVTVLRNDVHLVEWRGGITEIWEGMKHKVWTNNFPVLKEV